MSLDSDSQSYRDTADSLAGDTAVARRRWAHSLIRRASSPPRYGSPEWLALPEGSPAKVAAVIVAAEAWAVDADDLAERLAREVDAERSAFKRVDDEEYRTRAAEHRAQWSHLSRTRRPYVGQQVRPLEDIGREYAAQRRTEREAAAR